MIKYQLDSHEENYLMILTILKDELNILKHDNMKNDFYFSNVNIYKI
jgi:hypothetical protein